MKTKYKKNFKKVDNYQEVTNEIVKALESNDSLPWVKPWKSVGAMRNAFTKRPYRGLNTVILGMQPYNDPRWATFNQISKAGGKLVDAKGKGVRVVLWKFINKEDDEGNQKVIPLLRTFTVFNVECTEGLDLPSLASLKKDAEKDSPEIRDDLEQVISDTEAVVNFGGDRAYYSGDSDEVTMPVIESFDSQDAYYSVMFHELGHWSGHSERMNRDGIVNFTGFGSVDYAFEELVAELTSAFIGRDLRFDGSFRDNHSAYIKSWIKVLKNDKRAIFKAASQAEKAAKFIMGDHAPDTSVDAE